MKSAAACWFFDALGTPSSQLPIMPTPLPLVPFGIGMKVTLPATLVTAGSSTAVLISPGQTEDWQALAVGHDLVAIRGVGAARVSLGDALEVVDQEADGGLRCGVVEDDVPVLVEHVTALRPEDRQEIGDDRVGGLAPDDVTGQRARLVLSLRVGQHLVIAGRRGRVQIVPVHEHLDVADDRHPEQLLAACSSRSAEPGPRGGGHVPTSQTTWATSGSWVIPSAPRSDSEPSVPNFGIHGSSIMIRS